MANRGIAGQVWVRTRRAFASCVGAVLVLASLLPARALAGPNLVLNGNFATGGFANWTLTNAGSVNSNAVVIKTDNVSRNYPLGAFGEAIPQDPLLTGSPDAAAGYAAYFSTDTGTQTLSQKLTLSPGIYGIGFDVYVPSNGYGNTNDATFTGKIAGTSLLSSTSVAMIGATDGVTKWVTVSAQAQIATAGTYDVTFSFAGGGVPAKDILVNRVYLADLAGLAGGTPIPEPDALALLAVPLFGLIWARRRRYAR